MVLAVPWIALNLYRDVHLLGDGQTYLAFSLLATVPLFFLKWLVLAFFFGYFFSYLPGGNGLWKGCWLAVGMSAPGVLLVLLDLLLIPGGGSSWGDALLWALEVFVTLILLGFLVGDLKTLRVDKQIKHAGQQQTTAGPSRRPRPEGHRTGQSDHPGLPTASQHFMA